MKPLFIPLKTEWFNAFKSGAKKFEMRKHGPRWNAKTCPPGRAVVLSKGYGKYARMSAMIDYTRFVTVGSSTIYPPGTEVIMIYLKHIQEIK